MSDTPKDKFHTPVARSEKPCPKKEKLIEDILNGVAIITGIAPLVPKKKRVRYRSGFTSIYARAGVKVSEVG